MHAPPPEPQITAPPSGDPGVPGPDALTQVFPLQHPPGQDIGVHWHWFPTHSWPAGHADAPPHRHCPLAQVSPCG